MNRIRLPNLLSLAALILVTAWWSPAKKLLSDSPQPIHRPIDHSHTIPPQLPSSPTSITPPARSEQSRASSRRDFGNPLVPSSFEEIPTLAHPSGDSSVSADFDQITAMFRDYRTIIGENPVGTPAEIMKAIMGENPKSAVLGPPEGQQVNGHGELLDHWGNPYFFHQLSKDVMEIRSAGADQRMWTRDDIVGK